MLFLIGALRAVVELIGLCLLGQGVLYLISGGNPRGNPIYRLFAILTAPPRQLVRMILPPLVPSRLIPVLTFMLIFFFWIGLAFVRTFI